MNHKMYSQGDMKEGEISFDDTYYSFEDEYDREDISMEENMRHSDDDIDCMMGSSDEIMYEMFDREQYCPMCSSSQIPCQQNKIPCTMINEMYMGHSKGMPYMVEIEDDDEDDNDNINEILEKMEKKNPEIFTFMAAYGIPFPIIKRTLKRIIRLTLMYK